MAEKYAEQLQQPTVCGKFPFGRYAAGCVSVLCVWGDTTEKCNILVIKYFLYQNNSNYTVFQKSKPLDVW